MTIGKGDRATTLTPHCIAPISRGRAATAYHARDAGKALAVIPQRFGFDIGNLARHDRRP